MANLSTPLRVVMIDDDPDDIFLTKIICKRSAVPIEFKGLNSGRALYERIKNSGIGSINVILLDVNMPIENGYEVLKKLLVYPGIEDVKIIMFSTSRRSHDKELAIELGGDGFIEKPSQGEESDEFINMFAAYHKQKQPELLAAG